MRTEIRPKGAWKLRRFLTGRLLSVRSMTLIPKGLIAARLID
jgi:hypothetical protein